MNRISAFGHIDYPIAPRLYTHIHDNQLAGPHMSDTISGYVSNSHNYHICQTHIQRCIGVAPNEHDLGKFKEPYALITNSNVTLMKSYDVPVYGIENTYVKYGILSEDPFYVEIYPTSKTNGYFVLIILACMVCIFVAKTMCKICYIHIRNYVKMQKRMKTRKYHEESNSLLNSNCTICLDDFVEDENLVELTQCKHVFHKECINTWFNTKHTCPNCQNTVV
jgi:hypothetical protein